MCWPSRHCHPTGLAVESHDAISFRKMPDENSLSRSLRENFDADGLSANNRSASLLAARNLFDGSGSAKHTDVVINDLTNGGQVARKLFRFGIGVRIRRYAADN